MAKILKAETIETDLLGSNGNNALSLQRNSSSLLTLNTSDNVGIGTTVPTSKFEVKGSSNPGIALSSTDTNINTGGVFRVNLTNASSTLFEAGLISVRHSSSNQTLNAENSYISFSTRSTGTIGERVRIDNAKLSVVGGTTNVNIGQLAENANFCGISLGTATTVSAANYALLGNAAATDVRIGRATGGDITFTENNGTAQVTIKTGGNVGIGTTNPRSALDLGNATGGKAITWGGNTGGNRYASIFTAYSSGALVLSTNFHGSDTTDTYISSFGGTNSLSGIRLNGKSTNGIQFFTDSSVVQTIETAVVPTERMRIDSSGNVGIGTTSPTASHKLTISAADARMDVTSTNTTFASLRIISNNASYASIDAGLVSDTYVTTKNIALQPNGGNVGIGTASPAHLLEANSGSANTTVVAAMGGTINGNFKSADYLNTASARWTFGRDNASTGDFVFKENTAERMRIATTTGNVGIGTASPTAKLTVSGSSGTGSELRVVSTTSNTGGKVTLYENTSACWEINAPVGANGPFTIKDIYNNAERLRITSGGYLKASNTATYVGAAAAYHEIRNDSSGNEALVLSHSAATAPYGIQIRFTASPNDAASTFLTCTDGAGTTLRAEFRSNGGLRNYQTNDGNLSDERLKKDIAASPSYLEKICTIPVVNFKYKDQTHDDYNLGVIAQQLEAVCPELVDADGFGETPEDGIPLKSIYQTDLQYALMKCIQELKTENDSLKSRIEALEAK